MYKVVSFDRDAEKVAAFLAFPRRLYQDDPRWIPDGPGTARVAVIDEAGRSSAVTVRIVMRP